MANANLTPLPASSVPQTCRARVVPPQMLLQERDPHQPEFLAAVKEVRSPGCCPAVWAPPRRATKATAPTCQRSNFNPTPKPALLRSWLRCKSLLTHHSPTACTAPVLLREAIPPPVACRQTPCCARCACHAHPSMFLSPFSRCGRRWRWRCSRCLRSGRRCCPCLA